MIVGYNYFPLAFQLEDVAKIYNLSGLLNV